MYEYYVRVLKLFMLTAFTKFKQIIDTLNAKTLDENRTYNKKILTFDIPLNFH